MEILVVLIIALIVFGPKRLPELGNSLGRGIREFGSAIRGEHGNEDEEAKRLESSRAAPAAAEEPAEYEVTSNKRS